MVDSGARIAIRRTQRSDSEFVLSLGELAFAIYSSDPRSTMRAMLNEPNAASAVAEFAGLPAGFAVVRIESLGRPFGPLSRPAVAHLDAIAVHPDHKRRGVGRALLAWVEAQAIARGAHVLALNTAVSNTPAKNLFVDAGFMVLANIGPLYARGRPAVAMAKALPIEER